MSVTSSSSSSSKTIVEDVDQWMWRRRWDTLLVCWWMDGCVGFRKGSSHKMCGCGGRKCSRWQRSMCGTCVGNYLHLMFLAALLIIAYFGGPPILLWIRDALIAFWTGLDHNRGELSHTKPESLSQKYFICSICIFSTAIICCFMRIFYKSSVLIFIFFHLNFPIRLDWRSNAIRL